MSNNDHTVQSFLASRKFTMDIGKLGLQKHHIKALIEVDVTESRKKIKQRRTELGSKVSFTSWVLKCISQAISEHKQVHALRKGTNKLIIFDSIDISVLVEKKVEGVLVPLPLVIRDVNNKSLNDIYTEIENAKKQVIENESHYVIEKNRKQKQIKFFSMLPQWLRLLIWKVMLRNPHRMKNMMGTAVVTSVGMIGNVDGWIIPYSIHPVCFAIGSVTKKPRSINGTTYIRELLKITVLVDHDVIDGAPATRFVSRLSELMESGYVL
jgi:pyruvate/2-oxoglutarate dehydrogenase complex dihydrolipoamide acyltransferase (E2) component